MSDKTKAQEAQEAQEAKEVREDGNEGRRVAYLVLAAVLSAVTTPSLAKVTAGAKAGWLTAVVLKARAAWAR